MALEFLIELQFRNVGFWGGRKPGEPREKPNPHMTPGLGIEPLMVGERSHHCATPAPTCATPAPPKTVKLQHVPWKKSVSCYPTGGPDLVYNAGSGNRTWDTLMVGEHCHYCATPAPPCTTPAPPKTVKLQHAPWKKSVNCCHPTGGPDLVYDLSDFMLLAIALGF